VSNVVTILPCLLAAAAGVVFVKYGTLGPCGILRAQVRQEAAHEGGLGAAVATMLPDNVIDGLTATQYGALTPGRCVTLLFNPAPAAPAARRAPSVQWRLVHATRTPAHARRWAAEVRKLLPGGVGIRNAARERVQLGLRAAETALTRSGPFALSARGRFGLPPRAKMRILEQARALPEAAGGASQAAAREALGEWGEGRRSAWHTTSS